MLEVERGVVKKIAGLLRHARDQQRGSAFLIGAGASITAKIPTAKQLIAEIHRRHEHLISGLTADDAKNYGICMHRLTRAEREDLIKPYLENAKLNWGHIALAQLVAKGYVNRVLSFNFDLVLEKAAALLGLQVPVYDFGAAPSADVNRIARPAIVHLHGQSFGFVMLNSNEETEKHREALKPLFRDTLHRQQLFVIGYSGAADASLKTIEEEVHEERIVWLGYSETMDPALARLMGKPYCEYVGNADFDRTMIAIAQELGCWPPQIIANPITHLIAEFDPVVDYPIAPDSGLDLLGDLKVSLKTAESDWELRKGSAEAVVAQAFKAPEDRDRIAAIPAQTGKTSVLERDASAWLAIDEGNALDAQARTKKGDAADVLFESAAEKYRAAIAIKPDSHVAFNNWGRMLAAQARTKAGEEADALFQAAIEKYKAAIAIKPDSHGAFNNWGSTLGALALTKSGEEADALFQAATEKYQAAIAIKPDKHEALDNWGATLLSQASRAKGSKKQNILEAAGKKISAAMELNSKYVYNYACFLALTLQEEAALDQLEIALKHGTLPRQQHLETDSDLDVLRLNPRFLALLEKAAP